MQSSYVSYDIKQIGPYEKLDNVKQIYSQTIQRRIIKYYFFRENQFHEIFFDIILYHITYQLAEKVQREKPVKL